MPIDSEKVQRFLAARRDVQGVRRVGAGAWSTAFSFECEGRRRVVRFGRHVEDFRKDERAAQLYAPRLPVPRVLEIGDAFEGYAYAISEWAEGGALDALPEAKLRRALPSLLDTLDAIRAVPAPTARGFGWWSSRGRALHETWREALLSIVQDDENPRLAGWQAFLHRDAEASRVFERAAGLLEDVAMACPDGVRHAVHSDLLAGNVLAVDGSVSAVIDWGNSLVGDFLYDVAWLVFWSPWHPGLDPDVVLGETRRRGNEAGADLGNFAERLLAGQLHIALDSMAYNAFRRDEANLAGTLRRLAPLLEGSGNL